jgi:hypothetical protein
MNPLLLALAVLAPSGEEWWNKDWKYRRPLEITNRLDRALEKGYTMQVEFDPDYLGVREHSKKDFTDWSITYKGVRLPCLIRPGRVNTVLVNFRLAGDIRAEGIDKYQFYYGNPDAEAPKTAPSDVFEFYEDFSRPETLAERFQVDKDLKAGVKDGALVVSEIANGRNAATPGRIVFRQFPAIPDFEFSFDLEMVSTDDAGAALLATIDLKEPGVQDPSIDKKVERLIELLGDDAWQDREKATRELIALGRPAVPRLSEAARGQDVEIKWRSIHILARIADKFPPPLFKGGVVGTDPKMPVALSSDIGANHAGLKVKSGWPVKTRVSLQRDSDGGVKIEWDGRSPQSGQMSGEIREAGFSISKGSNAPLGTIRISNILVRRYVEESARPTSLINLEETRP